MRPHGDTADGSASLDSTRSGVRPSLVRFLRCFQIACYLDPRRLRRPVC